MLLQLCIDKFIILGSHIQRIEGRATGGEKRKFDFQLLPKPFNKRVNPSIIKLHGEEHNNSLREKITIHIFHLSLSAPAPT